MTHLIAALLIMSAAFCAAAQSRAANRDENTRDQKPIAPAKQNTRQTTSPSIPAKRNERASETQPSSTVQPATTTSAPADAPHYFYEFKQPDFFISHLQVEHDAEGHGHVAFEQRGGDETITEPFDLSEAARARIKTLWDNLRFLDSDKNYQSDKKYPHLGTVRLSLKQGTRERSAEFNWTDNKDAYALANEYRRVGDQAVLVFDISVALENDPLRTPKLMDQIEDMVKRNGLSDPQQLLPLLKDLTTDERIPLIARNHAERLVKQIKK